MARLATVGFESQRLATGATSGERSASSGISAITSGTVGIETTTVRSGRASASFAQNAANYISLAAPTTLDRAYNLRGYFRFTDATPSTLAVLIQVVCNAINVVTVQLSTTGKLQLLDSNGAQVGSDSATLSNATWYRIELAFTIPTSGTTGTAGIWLDGTNTALGFANLDLNNSITTGAIRLGNVSGGQAGVTTYLDDVALNDSTSGGTQTGNPGEGSILFAVPVSDNALGNWEAPQTSGSDVTNIFSAADNTPPVGVAHSDVDANNNAYIFNANATVPSSYDANCQSYTAVGMPSGGRVRFATALARLGTNDLTGTNAGELKLVSNPADSGASATSFEASAATAGTDPTGWVTYTGGRVYDPSVTNGTEPVVRVTKTTSSTRANMADQIGVLLEYDVPIRPTLTPATETDTAQALVVTKPIYVSVTAAVETDSAQTVTISQAQVVSVTAATEADSATALSVTKPILLGVSSASEVDTAQTLLVTKPIYVALTRPTEADTAQALVVTKPLHKALTATTETDSAKILTYAQPFSLGVSAVTETDSAKILSVTKPIYRGITVASETDTAKILVLAKFLSTASETDSAGVLSLTVPHYLDLITAIETDNASDLDYNLYYIRRRSVGVT